MADVRQKKCRRCELILDVACFYACRRMKDGLHSYCKRCCKWYNDRLYANDPLRWVRARHGMLKGDYERMLESQFGACAICLRTDSGHVMYPRLVVDHDHKTGEVRGLLCHPCNSAVGLLRDNIDAVGRMEKYLRRD